MGTITSANASVVLSVPDVFPVGQILAGFAADDAFTAQAFKMTEQRMGVDGKLSAGYTPSPKPFGITFQPDSPSILVFDTWGLSHISAREALEASMVIVMPSIGKAFHFSTGWLDDFKALPDAKKVLEPQTYTIIWQDIVAVPI
jgi:hypothetical protein